jgi:hypothetical protein
MKINEEMKSLIYKRMWADYKIGLSRAEDIIRTLLKESYFSNIIENKLDIETFFEEVLANYLFPSIFNREKIYDKDMLINQGVKLVVVGEIPDGWECKLYYDEVNKIYWEDHFGRNSIEGVQVSPYVAPLVMYGLKS